MPFCQRCNTNLENYMKFCWNCGTPQAPQQVFGGGPPVQQQAYQQTHHQESFTVSSGSGPYDQHVTVSVSGPGVGQAPPPPHVHGHMQVNRVMHTCPFCEGEGTHPMNFDQPCPVCRGAGKFTVMEPYTQCQQCEGSGKKFATMDEICPSCHGRGVIQM